MTCRVVRQPHKNTWHASILTSCHEEGHAILHARGIDVGDSCIANNGEWESEQHHYASQAETVGDESHNDCDTLDIARHDAASTYL